MCPAHGVKMSERLIGDIIMYTVFAIWLYKIFTGSSSAGSSTYTPPPKENDDLRRLREIADYDRWEKGGRNSLNSSKRDISKDI